MKSAPGGPKMAYCETRGYKTACFGTPLGTFQILGHGCYKWFHEFYLTLILQENLFVVPFGKKKFFLEYSFHPNNYEEILLEKCSN